MDTQPPKRALQFLRWFCRKDFIDEIEGDLIEIFELRAQENPKQASRSFWWQVIRHFRPDYIKSFEITNRLIRKAMLLNYLKIGWRNLIKHKVYSSIKIGGFSVGIAACILIFLFIRQELSYDTHYQDGEQLFRVSYSSEFDGYSGKGAHFPSPFAEVIKEEFPEIELSGRYIASRNFGGGSNQVRRADKAESSHEDKIVYADQDLLQILEVPFIKGNAEKALEDLNSIVITKRKAEKYFPKEDPIGKVLMLNNDDKRQYKVTGVIENFPLTSHFQFDFLISLSNREFYEGESTNWGSQNYITYVKLREGTDVTGLETKMLAIVDKYFLPQAIEKGRADNIAWIKSFAFGMQPIQDIYLNIEEVGDSLSHGDIRYIWLFGAIALFILLIACINFINLSTAKSANRAKEVGLRKTIGSNRGELIKQFLSESLFLSFIALIAGVFLANILLPYFNALLGFSLSFPWTAWGLLPSLLFGTLVVGIIAGIYPAFYLSSFRPISVLKGDVSRGSKKSKLRSTLVIFQFTVSIVLIVSTLIVNQQMDFILNKKLGYDKDQVIILQGTHTLENKISVFKDELLRLPNVTSASVSGFLPVAGFRMNNGGWMTEGLREEDAISGQQWSVDRDYAKTLGLNFTQGRDFSEQFASDSQAVVINESLAKQLNFEDPIGKEISNYRGKWTIIGVVEDFHFESLKDAIRPLGMYLRPSTSAVSVKVNTSDMPLMIQSLADVWKEFSPNQEFRFSFLDSHYAQMYKEIEQVKTIFTLFASLAVIVACLGLFALSSYLVEQRRKEISIRLILGASMKSIFKLLTSNFVMLVFIAFVAAIPLAWYFMERWLQDYTYRVNIEWNIFLAAGILSVFIALFTISYQAIKASLMNPVKHLKDE